MTAIKPLIKYIGGKTKLAPQIVAHMPPIKRFVEPFVGGGAVFALLYSRGLLEGVPVVLADASASVVQLYRDVQDPESLEQYINRLRYLHRKYHHPDRDPERLYYEQRDFWNEGHRPSWRYTFLKQTAFNGLWRENASGELNASWGKYKTAEILNEPNVRAWHQALQQAELHCCDFERVPVAVGSVVYADPPYAASFDKFTASGFDAIDQARLAVWLHQLRANGSTTLLSNSCDPSVLRLLRVTWPEHTRIELSTVYSVNCDGEGRSESVELLAIGD